MLDGLQLSSPTELSVSSVLLNLVCAAVLSFILSWHFQTFGSSFSNRRKFANVLPFICLTTVLVISVVKASLALSLGLVGALSIVRFRTPVKEPEELAYLFLSIAIGLGFGAEQRLVSFAAVGMILLILTVRSLISRRGWRPNLYLNVDIPSHTSSVQLNDVLGVLQQHTSRVNLQRYDIHGDSFSGTFYVDCSSAKELNDVQTAVMDSYPSASVTFVDQATIPGV
ncbi:MAG: putative membrane protein YhiD involved in acid resistance [Pirellulaceae bacterium]|jgi:uncharacterized membrane protein YhiD involved in acid resistance